VPGSSEPDLGEVAADAAALRSDWDIGILGPAGAVLEAVWEELETLRTLETFDVVDLARVPDGFRRAALAEAVALL
jgi:hypothetical protein